MLQRLVSNGVLRFVDGCAGVWVVLAKQCAVGVADLGLARTRRNSQDGVEVWPLDGHGHVGRKSDGRGPGREAGATGRGGLSPGPRQWAPFGRGRRAVCVRRVWVERAGGASSHLVRVGSRVSITCLSVGRASGVGNGGERCRTHPPIPGWHGRCLTWPEQGRCRRVCDGRGGTRAGCCGCGVIGGVSHSAATIASNSARSRSASAQTMSRNWSSTDGSTRASEAGLVAMADPCRVRR